MRKFVLAALSAAAIGSLAIGSLASSQSQTQKLRVGLGYLPDVQFAPFYLAQNDGFYSKRGIEVEFQHGFATELYPLLAAGKLSVLKGTYDLPMAATFAAILVLVIVAGAAPLLLLVRQVRLQG